MTLPIPTLLLKPNGSRDRRGPISPTLSGAVRTVPGQSGDAWFVEEGTTNLVGNPWHAVGTLGWTGTTRSTAWASQGPASGLITASGAGATATYLLTVPASAHTMQAIVRNNAASARTFRLRYNSANVGTDVVVAAGAVATLTAPITGTAASAAAEIVVTDSVSGETYNVGYLGIEAKAYATSPCPAIDAAGTVLTGYTWAGTAHASASTRASSVVSTTIDPPINPLRGEVAMRVNAPMVTGRGNQRMLRFNATASLSFGISGAGRAAPAWYVNNVAAGAVEQDLPIGEWVALSTFWDGDVMGLSVDGLPLITGPLGSRSSGVMPGDVTVGRGITGQELNGYIANVLFFDRPLTDAERAELFAMGAWEWDRFGGRTLSFAAISS